jgi:hypothetical protein
MRRGDDEHGLSEVNEAVTQGQAAPVKEDAPEQGKKFHAPSCHR